MLQGLHALAQGVQLLDQRARVHQALVEQAQGRRERADEPVTTVAAALAGVAS